MPALRLSLGLHRLLGSHGDGGHVDTFRYRFRKSFRILTAQSGTAGLAIVQREPVALVVA